MKTLEDLYKEVMASEDLKKAFAQAAKDKKVADFLKTQGCEATEDEFKAFLTEKAKDDKALSEEDLENVALLYAVSRAISQIKKALFLR